MGDGTARARAGISLGSALSAVATHSMSCVGTSSRPLALPTVSLTLRVTTAAARCAEPGFLRFPSVPCAGGAGARGGFFGFFGGFVVGASPPRSLRDRLAVHENLVVCRCEFGEARLRAEGRHCTALGAQP